MSPESIGVVYVRYKQHMSAQNLIYYLIKQIWVQFYITGHNLWETVMRTDSIQMKNRASNGPDVSPKRVVHTFTRARPVSGDIYQVSQSVAKSSVLLPLSIYMNRYELSFRSISERNNMQINKTFATLCIPL